MQIDKDNYTFNRFECFYIEFILHVDGAILLQEYHSTNTSKLFSLVPAVNISYCIELGFKLLTLYSLKSLKINQMIVSEGIYLKNNKYYFTMKGKPHLLAKRYYELINGKDELSPKELFIYCSEYYPFCKNHNFLEIFDKVECCYQHQFFNIFNHYCTYNKHITYPINNLEDLRNMLKALPNFNNIRYIYEPLKDEKLTTKNEICLLIIISIFKLIINIDNAEIQALLIKYKQYNFGPCLWDKYIPIG